MLISLYRNGPLRQRVAKGYVVAASDPGAVVSDLVGRPPDFPTIDGHPCALKRSSRQPAALWLDTGMIWLDTAETRTRRFQELAETAQLIGERVRRAGGQLLPAAARPGPGPWRPWLCSDLHSIEVLNGVQREVTCNLFRQHAPELIALTGRAGVTGHLMDTAGSRRLAEAADQIATRYIASVSPRHLTRIQDRMRRDQGVARLELMDVNPLGDASLEVGHVELRFVDAQVLLSTTRAHALLVQAIAMRARRLERDGRRVPSGSQALLERNRARAIAHGLSARFEVEAEGRGEKGQSRGEKAVTQLLIGLLEDLRDEFRALEATFDELAPVVLGLSLERADALPLRNENDLLQAWRRAPQPRTLDLMTLSRCVSDASWAMTGWMTRQNQRAMTNATSLVRQRWKDRLAVSAVTDHPSTRRGDSRSRPSASERKFGKGAVQPPNASSHETRTKRPVQKARPRRDHSAQAFFAAVGVEMVSPQAVTQAIHTYLDNSGDPDLHRQLVRLDKDRASQIRRALRPRREATVTVPVPAVSWGPGAGARAVEAAWMNGSSLIRLDVAVTERTPAQDAVRKLLHETPQGLRTLLIADTAYGPPERRRVALEVLVVRHGEDPQG